MLCVFIRSQPITNDRPITIPVKNVISIADFGFVMKPGSNSRG